MVVSSNCISCGPLKASLALLLLTSPIICSRKPSHTPCLSFPSLLWSQCRKQHINRLDFPNVENRQYFLNSTLCVRCTFSYYRMQKNVTVMSCTYYDTHSTICNFAVGRGILATLLDHPAFKLNITSAVWKPRRISGKNRKIIWVRVILLLYTWVKKSYIFHLNLCVFILR